MIESKTAPMPHVSLVSEWEVLANRDAIDWMLAEIWPQVRKALESERSSTRERAIRIVAWQGDVNSLDQLRTIQAMHGPDADLALWAITKINSCHPKM